MFGNISNNYVNEYTNEKVYAVSGKESGNLEGIVVLIQKELYVTCSFSENCHAHFADTLRGIGFQFKIFDSYVWIKL